MKILIFFTSKTKLKTLKTLKTNSKDVHVDILSNSQYNSDPYDHYINYKATASSIKFIASTYNKLIFSEIKDNYAYKPKQ